MLKIKNHHHSSSRPKKERGPGSIGWIEWTPAFARVTIVPIVMNLEE